VDHSGSGGGAGKARPAVWRLAATRLPFSPSRAPPSYTHRHCFQLARAPCRSCPHLRLPPRGFVWEKKKIDSRLRNRPAVPHPDSGHCHVREMTLQATLGYAARRGRGREASKVRSSDLPYRSYPTGLTLQDLPYRTYPAGPASPASVASQSNLSIAPSIAPSIAGLSQRTSGAAVQRCSGRAVQRSQRLQRS
jgi:hypothetical protein